MVEGKNIGSEKPATPLTFEFIPGEKATNKYFISRLVIKSSHPSPIMAASICFNYTLECKKHFYPDNPILRHEMDFVQLEVGKVLTTEKKLEIKQHMQRKQNNIAKWPTGVFIVDENEKIWETVNISGKSLSGGPHPDPIYILSKNKYKNIPLIPLPRKLAIREGVLTHNWCFSIVNYTKYEEKNIMNIFKEYIPEITLDKGSGVEVNIYMLEENERIGMEEGESLEKKLINFALTHREEDAEYSIEVGGKGTIDIKVMSQQSLNYAISTFLQLLLICRVNNSHEIGECHIQDYPEWEYRGFHLDVSRHFFQIEVIKKMLRLAYIYRLNKFLSLGT